MTSSSMNIPKTSLLGDLQATYSDLLNHISRDPVIAPLFAGSLSNMDVYTPLLKSSYPYVCKTVPWLVRASQLTQDPFLSTALSQKAEEEKDHDEWILADLKALGCDISEADKWPVSPAVAAYIAWHDFAIEELRPEAILGAAYILERLSEKAVGLVRRLDEQGFPARISSFMRGHGELDVGHVRGLELTLSAVDSNGPAAAQIRLSAQVTTSAYIGLLRSVA